MNEWMNENKHTNTISLFSFLHFSDMVLPLKYKIHIFWLPWNSLYLTFSTWEITFAMTCEKCPGSSGSNCYNSRCKMYVTLMLFNSQAGAFQCFSFIYISDVWCGVSPNLRLHDFCTILPQIWIGKSKKQKKL